jgi:uncharacterized phiE125 gp8 family phage protein
MHLKLLTPPTGLPLTLDEVKAHLRLDGSEEDALLSALIAAATEYVQNITNRQLLEADYELMIDRLPASIPLPRPPFARITEIRAIDDSGAEVVFDPTYYQISNSEHAIIRGIRESGWFASTYTDIRVTYTAGYASAALVPAAIKQAMLLIIGSMYENREDGHDRFPKASDTLLNAYRVFSF